MTFGSVASLIVFALALVIAIAIFLALREFFCWYWKVNEMVALLEEIRDRLPAPTEDEN